MIKPLADNILIEPQKEEKTTSSGIIIPETVSEDRLQKGKVVAVGSGKLNEKGERIALEVKVGNLVLFKKGYGAEKIKSSDKQTELLLVGESDILAIISE